MMRRLLARFYLRVTGWRLVGSPPEESTLIIGAFHTSNYDFSKLVAAKWLWDFDPIWIAKHTLFRRPFGGILRRMGGVPVRRDRRERVVDQMADLLRTEDKLLVIAPEGTRSPAPYWKSGFYHIALAADVPVALGFVDYRSKTFGIGKTIRLTGSVNRDMNAIRDFYRDVQGRRPENQGPVRLIEETAHAG